MALLFLFFLVYLYWGNINMKYCLSYKVEKNYLDQADEIKLPYEKLSLLFTKFLDYNKIFIIYFLNANTIIDWPKINKANKLTKGNLILCLNKYSLIDEAKKNNIKFYMGYEVNSFYELNSLIKSGAEYVRIGCPLIFDCDNLKKYKDKIRIVPNIAYVGVPRENPEIGGWIRPEDVNKYEDYINVIEFDEDDYVKEQSYFRIYKYDKKWNGDLKLLIHNFNKKSYNNRIPKDFANVRMNCKQRCQSGSLCKYCLNAITISQQKFDFVKNL